MNPIFLLGIIIVTIILLKRQVGRFWKSAPSLIQGKWVGARFNQGLCEGQLKSPPPPHPTLSPASETMSQVRSWFDRLTMNGPRHFKINCLAVRPEPVEGGAVRSGQACRRANGELRHSLFGGEGKGEGALNLLDLKRMERLMKA